MRTEELTCPPERCPGPRSSRRLRPLPWAGTARIGCRDWTGAGRLPL